MKKHEKLMHLEKSLSEGIIDKKEYGLAKEALEKEDEIMEKEEQSEAKPRSDIFLMAAIFIIVLVFVGIIAFQFFYKAKAPATLDDLHKSNLAGKLRKEQGYIYNGYSFVFVDGLWYTQFQHGSNLYNIPLHYGPRDMADIEVDGYLNETIFNAFQEVYMTFDPLGSQLQFVAVATSEIDQSLLKAFDKIPVGSCSRNETDVCKKRPIVTCENTKMPVIYVKEGNATGITFKSNCIIVEGNGYDIIKSADRLVLGFYGIM